MYRFLLLLLLVSSAFSNVTLSNKTDVYDDFPISYYYDENNALKIEDIEKKDFTQKIENQFTFGYVSGTFWFKISIKNETARERFFLSFKKLYADEFTIYEPIDKNYKKYYFGFDTFIDKKGMHDSDPIFDLLIAPNEIKTYYIKMNSQLGVLGTFKIYKHGADIHDLRRVELFTYMFYFGGLAMAMLLNGFLFFTLRDKVYGYYVAYIFTFGIFVTLFSNLTIDLGYYTLYYPLHAPISLVLFFLILFTNALLNVKKYLPKTYLLLTALNILFIILFFLILYDMDPWFEIMSHLTSIAFLVLLYAAFKISLLGILKAKLYLLLMMANVISLGLMTSVFNGNLTNTDFSLYTFLVVSFAEMGFFSLILANRINMSQDETIKMQKELLHQRKTNESQLEQKVQERTQELELLQIQLSVQANMDPLTELYNRRYFSSISENHFNIAIRHKQNLSLLMLDIDYFKYINDTYGHSVGDDVLINIANILRSLSRESDVVARYGGEEFIFLLPQTSHEEAFVLADRFRIKIEETRFKIDDEKSVNITVSIGVAMLDEEESLEVLIRKADVQLYKAKDNGRNRVC